MDIINSSVLITGGSEGIGRGLAERFLARGSDVMITGRNPEKLKTVADDNPKLKTYVNDIADVQQRLDLAKHVKNVMPGLNIVINNAGIQRRIALAEDYSQWAERQNEIDILFSAPVHINHLLIPQILANGKPGLIVNVSSGGAFIPQAFAPIYSACKAALHSYTITLRHSLSNTLCRVVELIPPAVKTALAGDGNSHGAELNEFCDAIFNKLEKSSQDEIGFGPTENLSQQISGQPLEIFFKKSASRFPIKLY